MIHPTEPAGLRPLAQFDGARSAAVPQDRLRAIRRGAQALRERMLDAPPVRFARSFNLLRITYPAWFAFTGVYSQQLLKPHMIHLLARTTVIQYDDFEGCLRTLLFTPADFEAGTETPYFKRLSEQTPRFLHKLIAPVYQTVPQALASCGLQPRQVDFITYDHLHTQDVRRWLGSAGTPGLLPKARLLVHRQELASVQGLLPSQAQWYCPHGLDGVAAERIMAFDGSIQLGPGVALVHTPGHTEGNHSLVYRSADGLRELAHRLVETVATMRFVFEGREARVTASVGIARFPDNAREGEALSDQLRRSGVWVDTTTYDGVTHGFFGLYQIVNKAMFAQGQLARNLNAAFGA